LHNKQTNKVLIINWYYSSTQKVNSFMQLLLQRVSFYLHCSLDANKDKMTPSAAVSA